MSKALFNPKYFTVGKSKQVNEADIINFVWSHAKWNLKVNEVKKFPDDVADALLRHHEFLIEATPKNVSEIRKMQEEKQLKCSECDFTTDTKVALIGHMKSHGVTEETKGFLSGIEEAQPTGTYKQYQAPMLTPEQAAGVPNTDNGVVKDKDGVEWYGEGVQTDTPTMK